MGFLNKKTIILDLPKLTYQCGEEVKGVIKFDFGEEKVKADKISIGLHRQMASDFYDELKEEVPKYRREQKNNLLLETTLIGKGEYTKEEIPFSFVIPNNAIQDDISFDGILKKLPATLKPLIEMLLEIFISGKRKKYSFHIIARIDIPWAIDITEKVQININGEIIDIQKKISEVQEKKKEDTNTYNDDFIIN